MITYAQFPLDVTPRSADRGPGHEMDVRPSAPRTAAATVSLLAASNMAVGMFLGFNQSARRWMVGRESGRCSLPPHGRTDNFATLAFSFLQQSHISHTNGWSKLTPYRDLASKLLIVALPLSCPILAVLLLRPPRRL